MKNFNDVQMSAVTGARWHARSLSGTFATPSTGISGYAAQRLVTVVNARIGMPAVVANTATAKQAPQSRRSSAHP